MVLPKFLMFLDGPALFWLDAHYSGGDTAVSPPPVHSEIRAILGRGEHRDVIFVDDVGHPGIDRGLIEIIVEDYPDYTVSFHNEYPACVALIEAKGRIGG
jgi:hypothetical protein